MAASSAAAAKPAIPPQEKYDVFLSFRGDTRNTFTSHLYAALSGKKITFIDDILERGNEISPALLEAIEKTNLSVIIFSKNYASSTWCLDELVQILECKKRNGQLVLPIFYDIDPSHVRNQQGTYTDAFAQLEERFKDNMDKVQNWRDTLTKAANLSGVDNSNRTRTDAGLVDLIVTHILKQLSRKSSSDLKGLFGIESRIQDVESLLCIDSPSVLTIGIWGMGGIGKTTLAGAVFNRLSCKYDASCFLANVSEEYAKHGPNHVRDELLRQILKEEDLRIDTPSIGSTFVQERLHRTKVFVVLDAVDEMDQIELLAGDDAWFGPGSRIIITTRDRSLLEKKNIHDSKIYRVQGLLSAEALKLFNLNAFRNSTPQTDYSELSGRVFDYAEGLPLGLKVLGSVFFHCKGKKEWEDVWNKLKKYPSKKIQNVLRLSYDGLEENEREIFLDITCFYKGIDVNYVKRRLHIRGFHPAGIKALIAKSLISISKRGYRKSIDMHAMIQEMGQQIVREQCLDDPGKRSRLFDAEDVYHVLENNTKKNIMNLSDVYTTVGSATVRSIVLNTSNNRNLHLSPKAFKKMYNLNSLEIFTPSNLSQGLKSLPNALRYLDWEGYPLKSLPTKFSVQNLVVLRMPNSQLELMWNEGQNLGNLNFIDLHGSKHLTELPDLCQSRNIEIIDLGGCESLVQLPLYIQCLDKLKYLELGCCLKLKTLPEMPYSIRYINVTRTAIRELSSSLWSHKKVSYLNIHHETLPTWTKKKSRSLESCSCTPEIFGTFSLHSFVKFSEHPTYITHLNLDGTAIEELPSSIECLFGLVTIQLRNCKRLASLPTSICRLKYLKVLDLTGCSALKYFAEILEPMERLEYLCLARTAVKELFSSIVNLIGLRMLDMLDCTDRI
ncbi:unnamed protein product [Malus baccata var. baccata]